MLLKQESSCLILIDVQEKLTPHIHNSQALVNQCQWILNLAHDLKIPRITSEQYPSGLKSTVNELLELVKQDPIIEKTTFSAYQDPKFKMALEDISRQQIVLIGIETHVCVLQTAIDMINADYEVFVIIDAVGSRYPLDHKYGLKRMKQANVQLVTSEMVFFEWIGQAGTTEFKTLSKKYLQGKKE
jgi:nicotinamidase-related amidase